MDGDSFYRTILDSIPLPVFLVDDDVRIEWLNAAAAAAFGLDSAKVAKRRGGEALHCLHAADSPEGCGRGPVCGSCVIRTSVGQCLGGRAITRKRMKCELLVAGKTRNLDLLITASPMPAGQKRALLIIEDITEVSSLRDIIPICARCKKIRDDRQYWHSVEAYFHDHIGVEFSHGLCAACVRALYPDEPSPRDAP